MERLIVKLKAWVDLCKYCNDDLDTADWATHSGAILTANEVQAIVDKLKHLQHYRDSTVGLWATDRPDKVSDPDGVLFQLGDEVNNG